MTERVVERFPVCQGQDLEQMVETAMASTLQEEKPLSRECAYRIHVVYDQIRDMLMKSQGLWEQYQHLYWKRKYECCCQILECLTGELKAEYEKRLGLELCRAEDLGQLRRKDYDSAVWRQMHQMMDQARGYTGVRRLWKKMVPQIPAGLRYGIYGALEWVVKWKGFMGGKG